RLRTRDGDWVVVEEARLQGAEEGLAVTPRAALATEVVDLLWRAYGLSPRERELVALVADGLDTKAIAQRLFISGHTVQAHLQAVFAKVGVRSRHELLTGVLGLVEGRAAPQVALRTAG